MNIWINKDYKLSNAFSLIELVIVISIVCTVICISYYTLVPYYYHHQAMTVLQKLSMAIATTKQHALSLGENVTLTPWQTNNLSTSQSHSSTLWQYGFQTKTASKVLRQYTGIKFGQLTLHTFGHQKNQAIQFEGTGLTYNNGHFRYQFPAPFEQRYYYLYFNNAGNCYIVKRYEQNKPH